VAVFVRNKKGRLAMVLLIRRDYVVYRLQPSGIGEPAPPDIAAQCLELDSKEETARLFKNDKVLQSRFYNFCNKGFYGIVWHNENNWLSYAWMSLPETNGPPHLPRSLRRLPVYWIFYCRTKEEYQGKGLFKASLRLLASWARERDPNAEVYIDTEPTNVPSRRAIEAVGFASAGIITTWTLTIPKIGSLVIYGCWDKKARHPEVRV